MSARAAIIAAATELFAERGYHQVTIRDIATLADASPAMVMKCCGSKVELFHQAATVTPAPLPDVPQHELGRALVDQVIDRLRLDNLEPLMRSVMLGLTAPDPGSIRTGFISGYVEPLTARLDGDDAALRAELAVGALLGLASLLRLFQTPSACQDVDETARRCSAVVQTLLDG